MRVGVAVVLTLLVVACGDETGQESDATVTATVAPAPVSTVAASPEEVPTADPEGLTIGDDIETPANMALYVEMGCWQCDGPTSGFMRVHRSAGGEIQERRIEFKYPIKGLAIDATGGQMAVGLCVRSECGHLEFPAPDAQTAIAWSHDGGVTFEVHAPLDGGYSVIGFTRGEVVVQGPYVQGTDAPVFLFPSMNVVTPPSGAAPHPFPVPAEILWMSEDSRAVLTEYGDELFRSSYDVGVVALDAAGRQLAIQGYDEESREYVTRIVSRPSSDVTSVDALFSLREIAQVASAWSSSEFFGNISLQGERRFSPALFDIEEGVVRPLGAPFDSERYSGRNRVAGVLGGRLVMVTGTGDCLRIREAPALEADEVACMADEVLLRDLGEAQEADGVTWVRVIGPGLVEGWASAEFLER